MIPRYTLPEMGSVWENNNRLNLMLKIELSVLETLCKRGIVPKNDFKNIKYKIKLSPHRIEEIEKITKHDLAAFVDQLSESVGDRTAKWIHFGLTSSDILDTATALQLKQSCEIILKKLYQLKEVLKSQSLKYKDCIMMGRTHGMHAEPTTFGYKLLGWYYEISQHIEIFKRVIDMVSVGKISGVVGTYSQLDTEIEKEVLKKLNLRGEPVATQVIPRYRYAYYISVLACITASIERFATEIRHLQRSEVAEVEEEFSKGQKGSSAMPHKHNPVGSENVCGMARLVRSYVVAGFENISLWHERDISHSSNERVILPDISIASDYLITRFTNIIKNIVVYPEKMLENMKKTYNTFFSQSVLSRLVIKGLLRDEAYRIVQSVASDSLIKRKDFTMCLIENKVVRKYLSKKEILEICSVKHLLRNINKKFNEIH